MTGSSYVWTGLSSPSDNYWSDPGNWSPGFTGSIGAGSTATISGPTSPWSGPATVVGSPDFVNPAVLTNAADYVLDVVDAGAINYVGGQDWTSATTYTVTAPTVYFWGDVVFSGGGAVTFADLSSADAEIDIQSAPNAYYPTLPIIPTIENVNNTFTGAAWFSGLGAGFSFQNDVQGVVDANGADGMTFYAMHVYNNGALAATGGGGLTLNNTTVDQTMGDGQTATGRLVANGADVQLDFATIDGGTLTASNGGVFETVNGGIDMLNGSTSAMTMTAGTHFEVQDNGVLEMIGTFSSAGEIDLDATATLTAALQIQGTVTPGAIVMSDEPTGDNEISGGGSGNVLDNTATISGAGEFSGLGAGLSVINESGAVIDATGANALEFYGVGVTNTGTLEATGAGGLELAGVTLNQNGGGKLTADGDISLYNVTIDGGSLTGTGSTSVTEGTATLNGATTAVTIAAGAHVAVDDGESLYLTGTIANSGMIEMQGMSGSSNYIASLYIEGTVTPGNIVMSDVPDNANQIGGGGTNNVLDNTATISGAGEFVWYGPGLSVVNEAHALIDANGANAMTFSGVNINNSGGLEATGAGGLVLTGVTLTQSATGELLANTGDITLQNVTVTGGAVVVNSGQTLTQTNSQISSATLALGSNVQANVVGGGDTINMYGPSGVVVAISGTSENWDTLIGSNAAVTLTGAQASLVGGLDTVHLDGSSSDVLSLYDSNNAWDTVYASNATINMTEAQASLVGGTNTVYLDGSSSDVLSLYDTNSAWDTVYASHATFNMTEAQASLVGGANTVYLDGSSSDVLSLYSTNNAWDTVYASNATFNMTEAQASLVGGADTIYLDGSSNDVLSLYSTNNAWDTVYASNATFNMTKAQASLVGGADTVYLDGSTTDVLSLYDTNNAWDTVYASNATFNMTKAQASLVGGADTIYLDGSASDILSIYNTNNAWDTVNASNATFNLTNAQANFSGSKDAIYLGGTDSLGFQPAFGVDTINGYTSADTLVFSAADQGKLAFSQSGANTLITLDANDVLTLTNVAVTSLGAIKYV